jgi:hypothetical protein
MPAALAFILFAFAARPVRAGDFEASDLALVTGTMAALAANSVFTIYDLALELDGKRPTRRYALIETFLTAPQVAFLVYAGVKEDLWDSLPLGVAIVWTAALAVHGAYFAFSEANTSDSESARIGLSLRFAF